jgi:RHS repeat-associated protein
MTSRNGTVIQWNGDGKPSSVGNVGFTYDGLGVRLKKISGGQTTRYIGGDYEIAADGTVTKYLQGGKKVGAAYFVHHRDHLGSIQAVTDSAGGAVRRQKHKPFGDQHYVSGSHLESKGWIGEREEETELLYLNARYYDPEIGNFTAPDPILGLGQDLNRFSYSANDPINFLDPTGLEDEPVDQCARNPRYCIDQSDPFWDLADAWASESEEYLARIQEANYLKMLLTYVDCTQPGVDCGPPPCAAHGTCPNPQTGTSVENPLTYCEKHPDRCGGKPPLLSISEGQMRVPSRENVLGYQGVHYGGYDIYVGDVLVQGNVLGEEAYIDPSGEWHYGPFLKGGSPGFGPLGAARTGLLKSATDPRVRDVIRQLFRRAAKIGNGSAMDAFRHERVTGELLSRSGHGPKLLERASQLKKLLKDPSLNPTDRQIVQELLDDILNALSGR